MARFNRRHNDYRGPEYDRRYGRYEGAYARRAALERWEPLRDDRRRRRGSPRRGVRPYEDEFAYEDRSYSRRYWPPAQAPRHRFD